jgi:hypothetical protein
MQLRVLQTGILICDQHIENQPLKNDRRAIAEGQLGN